MKIPFVSFYRFMHQIKAPQAEAQLNWTGLYSVIPGRIKDANLRCAIAHRGISRFRVWSFGPSRNDGCNLLLQMLGKERHAAGPGDIRAGLVVAGPLVAVKAVLRARIDVDLDLRPLGANGLDIGQRN